MDKIRRYIDCTIPTEVCNLRCSYCYLRQYNQDLSKKQNVYQYDAKKIREALRRDRLGGVAYFMFAGIGETLADKETIDVFRELLDEGHILDIVTNGTLTSRFKELMENIPSEQYGRLKFTFSLHYVELKEKNLLDVFFNNINYIREKGASFHVVLNHSDIYLPHKAEIQELCMERVGAYPQLAYTHEKDESGGFKICSKLSVEEYKKAGADFNSTLFEYQNKVWGQRRTEFCYAGDWSFTLNIGTGVMGRCHANGPYINIFEDISKPIPFEPVGHHCASSTCQCTRFLSMGVVPGICDEYTSELTMNRREAGWFSREMQEALSTKLYDSNNYPHPDRIRGKNIILYGAGNVGQSVRSELLESKECNLVLWVDKEPGSREGVSEVSAIKKADYDYVIVAIYNAEVFEQIKTTLLEVGVKEEAILWSRICK